jgi:hypothetical protein
MPNRSIPTWAIELIATACVLGIVWAASGSSWLELLGAAAVLAAFAHAQVADRMTEREAARVSPDVHCWRWSRRYFVAKEALWFVYFAAHGSWSALAGVVLFLLYPLWRAAYRRLWPLRRHVPAE